jgi:formylglycine-generating enzyme required for sulfatase activity
MDSDPSYFKECGLECPVEQVSWNEVQEFIRRINLKTDKSYRLPGETEWEYACRAGLRQQFCGSESLADVGWFDTGIDSTRVHRVGEKRANAFGLYDMSGNVWEWTQDCWELNSSSVQSDGAQVVGFDCDRRVRRGGAWNDFPVNAGAASRNRTLASDRGKGLGFRLAISLP